MVGHHVAASPSVTTCGAQMWFSPRERRRERDALELEPSRLVAQARAGRVHEVELFRGVHRLAVEDAVEMPGAVTAFDERVVVHVVRPPGQRVRVEHAPRAARANRRSPSVVTGGVELQLELARREERHRSPRIELEREVALATLARGKIDPQGVLRKAPARVGVALEEPAHDPPSPALAHRDRRVLAALARVVRAHKQHAVGGGRARHVEHRRLSTGTLRTRNLTAA